MKHRFTIMAIITVLLVVCTLVAVGCKKEKVAEPLSPVDGNSITYDGQTLAWDGVEGAESYFVYFGDSDPIEVKASEKPSLEKVLEEDFTVSVWAYADNENYSPAETKGIADFTYLKKVEEVFVNDRTGLTALYHFGWNAPMAGIEYYDTLFNGVYAKYDADSTLAFPIGEDTTGTCTFKVKPACSMKNTYSQWTEKTVTVLEAPHDFAFDPDNHMVSWKASNATSFKISELDNLSLDTVDINGASFINQNANPDSSEPHHWVYLDNPESFSLTVVSMGDLSKDILSSRASVRKFTKLDDVDNLKAEYSLVSWVPNSNANQYNVRVTEEKPDDSVVLHENTSVVAPYYDGLKEIYKKSYTKEDGTLLPLAERKPVQYKVSVRPVIESIDNNDIVSYSSWNEVMVTMISAPQIRWSENSVAWDAVPGAAGYSVRLTYKEKVQLISLDGNDKLIWSFNQDNSTQSGEYSVCVYANYNTSQAADANNKQGSEASNALKIIVLPAPERFTVMSNAEALAYGFVSEGSTERTDPSKEFTGASAGFESPELQFFFNTIDYATYYEVTHRYDMQYIGDEENESVDYEENVVTGTININDSADADWDKYFNVRTLISDASGRSDYVYIFARVDETKSYDAKNGIVVLNSNFSKAIKITKLAAPSGIKIGTDGKLAWNGVSQNSGYRVYIKCIESGAENHSTQDLSSTFKVFDTTFDVTDKITQPGRYEVYVAALGNNNVIVSSNYSNALTVVKLTTPKNPRVENKDSNLAVVWDYDPFTADDYTFNPSAYEIAIGDHKATISLANNSLGTSFNVDEYEQYIPASTPVRFVVKAIGDISAKDNVYLLDSEYSRTITLKRLDTPSTVEANSECVSWGRIDHADAIEVYDGEERIAVVDQTNGAIYRFDLEEANYSKYNGSQISHSFSIRGVKNNYVDESTKDQDIVQYYIHSYKSNALNVNRLATPVVSVDKNTGYMTWDAVSLATNYLVSIKVYSPDNKATPVEKYTNTYQVFDEDRTGANEIGAHYEYNPAIFGMNGYTAEIEVSSIGNEETTLTSFPYRYSLSMEKLEAPSKACFKIKAVELENGVEKEGGYKYYRITINEDGSYSNKGYGYKVNIGGVDYLVAKDENGVAILDVPASYAGEFDVKICAAGGNYGSEVVSDAEGLVHYLDSDYTEATRIKVIAASPYNNVTLDQTNKVGEYKLSFSSANGVKYKVTYSFHTTVVTWVEVEGEMTAQVEYAMVGSANVVDITAEGESTSINITLPENAYWVSVTIEALDDPDNLIMAGQVTSKTFTVNN